MTFSSEKLQENIHILSETLQAALKAISYLISEDASNTQALKEKVAEIDNLQSQLTSVDGVIAESFSEVIELAKEVMEQASQAPTSQPPTPPEPSEPSEPTEPEPPTEPVPPIPPASPVLTPEPTLPIGGEAARTPLQF